MGRARTLRLAAAWFVMLGIAGLLAAAGWFALFSTFMGYDDEGYVLLTLRDFAQSGALYDRVYTQYGPFYYLLGDALSRGLGFDWTSSTGRLVALACWLGSAGVCTVLVARRTHSLACSAFTLAATFACLVFDIYEPSHPGAFAVLLVAVAACIGSEHDVAARASAALAVGAVGAALALTKINVGGLLLISAAAWWLLRTASAQRPLVVGAICAALAALPWLLMRQLLAEPPVLQFAFTASLAVLGVIAAIRSLAQPVATTRALIGFALGALGVSLVTIGLILARGTSLSGLLHGVLLDPLHHPFVNFIPVTWSKGSAFVVGAAALVTLWASRTPAAARVLYVLGSIRLLAAAYIAYVALTAPTSLAIVCLSYGIGIAGLCALPMRFDAAGLLDARTRQWLGLLLVLQSLHAYPTAGSQISWGAFLVVPLLGLAVRDAWLGLAPARVAGMRWCAPAASAGVVSVGLATAGLMLTGALGQHARGTLLGLPGAERISLPEPQVLRLRALTENARVHGSVLFSAPGKYSFNLWSGRPTPTQANATLWPALLTPAAQREIIARLQEERRAVVIHRKRFEAAGELGRYLQQDFARAFDLGGYSFLVHRGRRIARVSTGRLRREPGTTVLELTLGQVSGPISRIELHPLGAPDRRGALQLTSRNALLEATPLRDDGQPLGPARELAWPGELESAITRLRVRFSGQAPTTDVIVADLFSNSQRIASAQLLP